MWLNKGRAGWGFRTFFEKVEARLHGNSKAQSPRQRHAAAAAARSSGSGEAALPPRANSQQACRCSLRESGRQRASSRVRSGAPACCHPWGRRQHNQVSPPRGGWAQREGVKLVIQGVKTGVWRDLREGAARRGKGSGTPSLIMVCSPESPGKALGGSTKESQHRRSKHRDRS